MVEKRTATGVEGIVFLHVEDRRLHRVQAASAALQHLPALCGRSFHAVEVRVENVLGNRPRPAVDQHYRIDRQIMTFR